MRSLLALALCFFVTIGAAGQERRGDRYFGPRYCECGISELHSIERSLEGQQDAVRMRVPGIFKSRMKREILKLAANEDEVTQREVRKLTDGLEEVVFVSYERCSAAFRDSLDRSLRARIQPSANVYSRDSVYLFGFRATSTSDTIKCLLMYMEAQSTVIYMTGNFPYKR